MNVLITVATIAYTQENVSNLTFKGYKAIHGNNVIALDSWLIVNLIVIVLPTQTTSHLDKCIPWCLTRQ